MKIKTSELFGPALDWAVQHASGEMMIVNQPFNAQMFAVALVFPNGTVHAIEAGPYMDWKQACAARDALTKDDPDPQPDKYAVIESEPISWFRTYV